MMIVHISTMYKLLYSPLAAQETRLLSSSFVPDRWSAERVKGRRTGKNRARPPGDDSETKT